MRWSHRLTDWALPQPAKVFDTADRLAVRVDHGPVALDKAKYPPIVVPDLNIPTVARIVNIPCPLAMRVGDRVGFRSRGGRAAIALKFEASGGGW